MTGPDTLQESYDSVWAHMVADAVENEMEEWSRVMAEGHHDNEEEEK